MTRTLLKTTALTALLWGGASGVALGQTYETGGIQLSFGVNLGIETQSNRTLAVGDPGASTEIGTDLTFGVLTDELMIFDKTSGLRL